jgi:stage III sporulation protein AF
MIAWMSEWLKQIIIVILLAAFVDLLMPNNGLQRYVRTVLGLFILLTLLSPIFSLFQKSLDTRKLMASVEQLPAMVGGTASPGSSTASVMKPLETLLQDANQLKTVNEQQAVQLLETRLSSELKSSLETVPAVKVKDVSVVIQSDNNGKPRIEKMQAILYNIDGTAEAGKDEPKRKDVNGRTVEPVIPVKPVQIQVRVGEAKAGNDTPQETTQVKEAEQQAKAQLYEL